MVTWRALGTEQTKLTGLAIFLAEYRFIEIFQSMCKRCIYSNSKHLNLSRESQAQVRKKSKKADRGNRKKPVKFRREKQAADPGGK